MPKKKLSNKKTKYQICSKCIMDTSDPFITFDKNGVCNHCHSYKKRLLEIKKRII